jgi:hypothetical protein
MGEADGNDTSKLFVVVIPARARVDVKELIQMAVVATHGLTVAGRLRDNRNGSEGLMLMWNGGW